MRRIYDYHSLLGFRNLMEFLPVFQLQSQTSGLMFYSTANTIYVQVGNLEAPDM